MLIVGELINGSRKTIAQALAQRDAEAILSIAEEQVEAGARLLDINAGTSPERETEDLLWLIEVISEKLDIALCIDSPNAQAMEAGLRRAAQRAGMINSITAERGRLESFLPLVEAHSCRVIALCMGDQGVPSRPQDRFDIAKDLVGRLTASDIPADHIFLDPIVCPVGVDSHAGRMALETLRLIKKEIPEAKTICGLSNISFGLPQRRLLNHTFLSIMLTAGLDAAILDPTDSTLMATLRAAETLLGDDEHCLGFISAHREGKLT